MTLLDGRSLCVAVLLAAACSATGNVPGDTCSYGGAVHQPGTTFPSTDGCNSCSCDTQGHVSCTEIACLSDGGSPVDANSCTVNGQTYPVGASIPDDCAGCRCMAPGEVACYSVDCSCSLGAAGDNATYTFGLNGGNVAYTDSASLTSGGIYTYSRTPAGGTTPSESCSPALPSCHSDGLDIGDLRSDFLAADVKLALASPTPPLYGVDNRPVDGQVFELRRSGGGGFVVGDDCPAPNLNSCRPIPAAIAKLVADLRALNAQQLQDPSCATLR